MLKLALVRDVTRSGSCEWRRKRLLRSTLHVLRGVSRRAVSTCFSTSANFQLPDSPGQVNVNLTVTVINTGTGSPFNRVGVNSHCMTASREA